MLVALIGAAVTVFIAAITYLLGRRTTRNRVFASLIADMNRRRALSIGTPLKIKGARRVDDYKHANLSVVELKGGIRHASDQIAAGSKLQPHLASMISACNRYLEFSAMQPSRYQFHLSDLSQHLAHQVSDACAEIRGVPLMPGQGAFGAESEDSSHGIRR